ncbi:MAG: S-methyl-5-thioribose-1-phosphate isomerase [Dehalococcoidia bacterium]|jgi:methylthioribose-1-phosphate isomerase
MNPIEWLGDRVRLLDQTKLPLKESYLELSRYQDIASAIVELKIRGAPAIGVAGGYAVALGALKIAAGTPKDFRRELKVVIEAVAATRPTARNLFRALERMEKVAGKRTGVEGLKKALVNEAIAIHDEEAAATLRLSELGAELIQDDSTIVTHCNTGPLATAGYGTALGVLRKAHEAGKKIKVLVDETRPLLQGARLTAWELQQMGIPFTLITDSMAGYFMSKGTFNGVNGVIVGADRIAANGDTANKIGTYTLAVLARVHKIPFYVAAPLTTIDPAIESGPRIPIEQRNPDEVTHIQGVPIAPEGIAAANPAFDVTPHRYITAIVTEGGIIRQPFGEGIKKITGLM